MSKMDAMKMLKDEISKKVDEETLKKFKNAKSKEEALSILEGTSIKLNDDMLAAVSGGVGEDGFCGDNAGWCDDNDCGDLGQHPNCNALT